MKTLAFILLGMVLTNNFVLCQFLGICPFLGVSKKLDSAFGMSVAVIFVMVMATAATWPVQQLLDRWGIGYLQTVVFILIIAALVQLVEVVMKKFLPSLHKSLGVYLPLITTNCAVLGVCIMNIDNGYTFAESLVEAAGGGIGFMLAMILFAGVRQRIENNDYPKAFKGIASTLVAASLVSMAFMGFSGVVEGIFGM